LTNPASVKARLKNLAIKNGKLSKKLSIIEVLNLKILLLLIKIL
jgi:hypothetical protein